LSGSFDTELRVAIDAAWRAGAIQRDLFERLEQVTPKGRRDVVTEADYRSEAAIIETIRRAFPHDAILAEESGGHGVTLADAIDGPRGGAAASRTWFIDPLDGTVNFANGIPFFCAAIGFALAGRPVVGVLFDPSREELLQAVRGRGAFRGGGATTGGRPFRVGSKESLEECLLGIVHQRGFLRTVARLRPRVRAVRDLGSAALAIGYVGGGRLDGYIQPRGLSPWDLCAAGLIAEEGGATVSAFDGSPWFRYPVSSGGQTPRSRRSDRRVPSLSALVAAPGIHAQLLGLLHG